MLQTINFDLLGNIYLSNRIWSTLLVMVEREQVIDGKKLLQTTT